MMMDDNDKDNKDMPATSKEAFKEGDGVMRDEDNSKPGYSNNPNRALSIVFLIIATAALASMITALAMYFGTADNGSGHHRGKECDEDLGGNETKEGHVTIVFTGLSEEKVESEKRAMQILFEDSYNELSGGCDGTFQRVLREATLDEYTQHPDGSMTTKWTGVVGCNGCPDDQPLFGMEQKEEGSSGRRQLYLWDVPFDVQDFTDVLDKKYGELVESKVETLNADEISNELPDMTSRNISSELSGSLTKKSASDKSAKRSVDGGEQTKPIAPGQDGISDHPSSSVGTNMPTPCKDRRRFYWIPREDEQENPNRKITLAPSSHVPTDMPSGSPKRKITLAPTSESPSASPSYIPSASPSASPSNFPSGTPSSVPSLGPSVQPSGTSRRPDFPEEEDNRRHFFWIPDATRGAPSLVMEEDDRRQFFWMPEPCDDRRHFFWIPPPRQHFYWIPQTDAPSNVPSSEPSAVPSKVPTVFPTRRPTFAPFTYLPTQQSLEPSVNSEEPTISMAPSVSMEPSLSLEPSVAVSVQAEVDRVVEFRPPTGMPTATPTAEFRANVRITRPPTEFPTASPTSPAPTSGIPTLSPTTVMPTPRPTPAPITPMPTSFPSAHFKNTVTIGNVCETNGPNGAPTCAPAPVAQMPTPSRGIQFPTFEIQPPVFVRTPGPMEVPLLTPLPTWAGSNAGSVDRMPTTLVAETPGPTEATPVPAEATFEPTHLPSTTPTTTPTVAPTTKPTPTPSESPTSKPSPAPTPLTSYVGSNEGTAIRTTAPATLSPISVSPLATLSPVTNAPNPSPAPNSQGTTQAPLTAAPVSAAPNPIVVELITLQPATNAPVSASPITSSVRTDSTSLLYSLYNYCNFAIAHLCFLSTYVLRQPVTANPLSNPPQSGMQTQAPWSASPATAMVSIILVNAYLSAKIVG